MEEIKVRLVGIETDDELDINIDEFDGHSLFLVDPIKVKIEQTE